MFLLLKYINIFPIVLYLIRKIFSELTYANKHETMLISINLAAFHTYSIIVMNSSYSTD